MVARITVRQSTEADVPDLVRLRRIMFEDMGYNDPAQLDRADAAAAAYFAIPAGEFYGWLALISGGEAVGSGGVVFDQRPPGPDNLSGRIGHIMNLVTVPCYRRQGIARRLMQAILAWLAGQGVHCVTLHATRAGRPLYEELGFAAGNEMKLDLAQGLE